VVFKKMTEHQEGQIIGTLDHPHIIKLLGEAQQKEIEGLSTKETEDQYLVLEHAQKGDLLDYLISQGKPFSETEARRLFSQLVSALSYAHSKGVCHRDLKLENLFLDDKLDMKIGDWGHSCFFSPKTRLHETKGTLKYSAPEIVLGNAYYGPAVDVWSAGVVLFAMISGHLPFESDNPSDSFRLRHIKRKIVRLDFELPAPSSPTPLSNDLEDLLLGMLSLAPRRLTLEQVRNHPWMYKDNVQNTNVHR